MAADRDRWMSRETRSYLRPARVDSTTQWANKGLIMLRLLVFTEIVLNLKSWICSQILLSTIERLSFAKPSLSKTRFFRAVDSGNNLAFL